MGTAACRRSCFTILSLYCLTAAVAVGDASSSSRRSQEPAYPEVIVEPDAACSVGVLGDGQPFCHEGYLGPYNEPYYDGVIGSACDSGYVDAGYGYDGDGSCHACDLCPCWTIRAGLVYLRRDSNRAIPIVAGTPSYSSGDLGFDYEPGPLVTLMRHDIFQSGWDLEFTYFGIDNFGASATTADVDTVLASPVINVPLVVPGRTDYTSELDSAEFNLRSPWNDWLTLMAGIRWIRLEEVMNTNVGAANHRIDVDNELFGFQLGAETYLWRRNRFSVEGLAKAGIYGNDAGARTTTAGVGGALPVVAANDDDIAFVGELGLTGIYDLSDRWSLRGGYQLLWIDGVALAPEQLNNMNIATGVATVDTEQTAFYHGFNLAAEFRY